MHGALLFAAYQAGAFRVEGTFAHGVLTRVVPGLKMRKAGFLDNVHGPAMFAVRDLLKDLDLGLALYPPPVPLTFLARQLFAAVAARTPDLDISAIVDEYGIVTRGT